MTLFPQTRHAATTSTAFAEGDYVLYRDPALYWAGKAGHTVVAMIHSAAYNVTTRDWAYNLVVLETRDLIRGARAGYMRLLPAEDAMRDIDTAPLNLPLGTTETDELAAGAVVWLTQKASGADGSPQLPPTN
ncbi:hypothetical protein [Streptomyces sp. NPDC058426]|uniref:hypothetical protein n=1 Tax=Streptomyces sp. NPDC058426 TaxID=3346493 RepID=UPI003650A171